MNDDVVGHKTIRGDDGKLRHEPLSRAEAGAIWEACEKDKDARAEAMPDEAAALKQLDDAHTRLKELGWSEAIYCPKDGSMFSAIEAGSTGIHTCRYEGKWPDGRWWVYDGDVWPARPILWRPIQDSDPVHDFGPCTMGLQEA